ncbi:MAG: DUF1207 domain-containing protein [Ignavibacteriales bacterium]|nr:DUF1207 domain-containing protein [Ignavibacteriales bacterium]MCF8435761.1 DUF1207 domain-containing protein [Ignavibacteriales bacterium]
MKRVLFILYISLSVINAQTSVDYFPSDLNFKPYIANIIEPKAGALFEFNENKLRLDIGTSIDLMHWTNKESGTFSFGADLFTYTLLRGESNFHFPVDAVDYLFGINGTWKKKFCNYELGARLRLSHISAHFVDGHFEGALNQWRDGLNPRVYSREFLEFIPYYAKGAFRFYAGASYIFHVDPSWLGKDIWHLGAEYTIPSGISERIYFYGAYDLRVVNIDKRRGNNSVNLGIKTGYPDGRGFSLYLAYYNGKNIHGEYFDHDSRYTAFGLNFDL